MRSKTELSLDGQSCFNVSNFVRHRLQAPLRIKKYGKVPKQLTMAKTEYTFANPIRNRTTISRQPIIEEKIRRIPQENLASHIFIVRNTCFILIDSSDPGT
ncbi:hypothetical protein [Aestuariivirga sp.]|uniref:hypothetical protein n=1 Tax=Aestuariivirga sp. TaxID=2650926 RepID=UPI0039E24A42